MFFSMCCFGATLIFLKGSTRSTLRPEAEDSRMHFANSELKVACNLCLPDMGQRQFRWK